LGEVQVREGRVFDPIDVGDIDKGAKCRKDAGEYVTGEDDADGQEDGENAALQEDGDHHGQRDDDKKFYEFGEVGEKEIADEAALDDMTVFDAEADTLSSVKAVKDKAHDYSKKEGDE